MEKVPEDNGFEEDAEGDEVDIDDEFEDIDEDFDENKNGVFLMEGAISKNIWSLDRFLLLSSIIFSQEMP